MDLAYDRHRPGSGSGTPGSLRVVLLHSLAMDRSIWDPVAGLLADRAEVVTVDLPGHGASPVVDTVTLEGMADEVAALLRGIGAADPTVVAGMSLGGCVAQALAVRHPDLVQGLALLDTTCWYGEDAAAAWAQRAQRAVDEGLASLADFQLARWFTPAFLEANPATAERLLAIFTANDVGSYVASCHAMGAFDYRDEVCSVGVPTLVLVGEHDPATPVPHARDLHERIGGSVLEVLPDASHLSAVERPDDVAALLDRHVLGRLPGRARAAGS